MEGTWSTPDVVVANAGTGWGGVWSLLVTAERAAAALTDRVPFAAGLELVWFGDELRTWADRVASVHPGQVQAAEAVDLGPVLNSDVASARHALAELLDALVERADELLLDNVGPGDRSLLVALTCRLFTARVHLTGTPA